MNVAASFVGRTALAPVPPAAPRARMALRLGFYAALVASDLLAIVAGFVAAGALTLDHPLDSWVVNDLAVLLPIHFGIAIQRKPYTARFFHDWRRTTRDVVTALLTAMATTLLIVSFLHATMEVSYRLLVAGVLLAAGLIVAARWGLHRLAEAWTGGRPVATVLAIDGDVPPGVVDAILARLPVVDVTGIGAADRVMAPDTLARFAGAIAGAERVIVACPPDRRGCWATLLRGANVQGEVLVPDWQALGPLRLSHLGAMPTAILSLGPLDTRNRLLKRGFDLAVAATALALLSPLLALVALAIRLDGPGPVLFRQPRVGRGNRLFHVLKFRSMHAAARDDAGERSTERRDPRVTRVGRLIRATSIDELPQLLNVLRGEMSIVGPRPHALGSLAGNRPFWDAEPRYWQRHAIKPGITGLAQVRGFRGATAQVEDLTHRVDHDLAYLRGWTLFRDLRIIALTLRVLVHPNAF